MSSITSALGEEQTVSVRRTESSDAEGINALINAHRAAVAVFGRVNVIHLLEKSNLAVSLVTESDQVLAQACFSDCPISGLVDQAEWEPFLRRATGSATFKPVNTLFLHLFVMEPTLALATSLEMFRAVFSAVPELQFLVLLSPHLQDLDPVLMEIFEPLKIQTGLDCVAQVCTRDRHCPQLSIRPARVEDHDDVMKVFSDHTQIQSVVDRPLFITELIESQDELQHAAVCLRDGTAVGFVSVTANINVQSLLQHYHLRELGGAVTEDREQTEARTDQSEDREQTEARTDQSEDREQTEARTDQSEDREQTEAQTDQSEDREQTGPASSEQGPEQQLSHSHRAFSVQLFSIHKNQEARSVDFLPYLFKVFPDRELCLVSVSPLAPELPLLQTFTRIHPRTLCAPPQELYALHRQALRPVKVRRAVPSDRDLVLDLVQGLDHEDCLTKDLDQFYLTETDQDRVPLQVLVVQAGTQLVGVVVLRDEQDVEYLRGHYNIEDFVYFSHHSYTEHAVLRHFVLRPSLQHHSRLVFREVLRLSHKSCLYHRVYPGQHPAPQTSCIDPLDFILDCAVPVRPRPQIDFPLEELGLNAPSNQITDRQPPYALYLISRKLTLEQKVTVNARIIVIGASDTGLSLLETLCCCPHLRFNNLSLVSMHGFPDDRDAEDFLSTSHAFSSRDLSLVPLSSVKTVSGTLVSIDRTSKHVQVNSDGTSKHGTWLPYDLLVLCTGLQYQVPKVLGSDPVPLNLWTLNGAQDWTRLRRWVQEELLQSHGHMVVFGCSIDAFTTVQALLSLGLSGPRISLVLAPSESRTWIPDPAVARAVALHLQEVQVQVYQDCELLHLETEERRVTSATFSCRGETLQIHCRGLVTLSSLRMDPTLLHCLLGAFLVVDGGLVVDPCFHTSDPWILAAGPLTRFSRRYHSDEWYHQRFCSREVGQDLARQILLLFDPTAEPRPPSELVPIYRRPKVTGGILPGGLHYLHVTRPTPSKHSSVSYVKNSRLVTGRPELGTYFCLQLDDLERVETITCASFRPLPLHNLLSLYGLQQCLLGNLSRRFSLGLVPDLYSFFRQSWCLAIFHDRFSDFQQELRVLVNHSTAVATEPRAEREESPPSGGEEESHPSGGEEEERADGESDGGEEEERADGESEGVRVEREGGEEGASPIRLDPEHRAAVRSSVVRYLSYNHNLLPMFSTPGQ